MREYRHLWVRALTSAVIALSVATSGYSQRLIWLNSDSIAPNGNFSPAGVSNNRVVVGTFRLSGSQVAVRWRPTDGFRILALPFGYGFSGASGVSADGSVVVGFVQDRLSGGTPNTLAVRWTAADTVQNLGVLPGYTSSYASGVSADGSVVVGYCAPWPFRPFRWTVAGGMQNLGTLQGYPSSSASAVSADGSTVVGTAADSWGRATAFRWTAGGMQDLGWFNGFYTSATAVSADGSVVVGTATDNDGAYDNWRWTAAGGMQSLGNMFPRAISADGSVVVGVRSIYDPVRDEYLNRAVRWTAGGGVQDLNAIYAHLLTNGSVLYDATSISPNGRHIVGTGYNAATRRFGIFVISAAQISGDVNDDGVVDDSDLLQVLFAFGSTGANPADVNGDGIVDDADLLIVLFNFGRRS